MESLKRHYDIIFEKLVKGQDSSAKIHIFLELVPQIILFLVYVLLIALFSLICGKKQTI